MKNVMPLFALLMVALTACGSEPAAPETDILPLAAPLSKYPATLSRVLNAHGGLDRWQNLRSLSYTIVRDDKRERQLVDLHNRRERIEQADATIGYDGEKSWVVSTGEFSGDPIFYRNLMFYFYAMPWVLADPGIIYDDTEPLVYDGVSYPGVKISYDDGIGLSPKDNYYLHYDEASGEMRWLGYTVTGRTGKPSDKISWINYPSWSDYGGVSLPDSLVWYTTENNLPVNLRNVRIFTDVKLSKQAPADAEFAMPEGADEYDM